MAPRRKVKKPASVGKVDVAVQTKEPKNARQIQYAKFKCENGTIPLEFIGKLPDNPTETILHRIVYSKDKPKKPKKKFKNNDIVPINNQIPVVVLERLSPTIIDRFIEKRRAQRTLVEDAATNIVFEIKNPRLNLKCDKSVIFGNILKSLDRESCQYLVQIKITPRKYLNEDEREMFEALQIMADEDNDACNYTPEETVYCPSKEIYSKPKTVNNKNQSVSTESVQEENVPETNEPLDLSLKKDMDIDCQPTYKLPVVNDKPENLNQNSENTDINLNRGSSPVVELIDGGRVPDQISSEPEISKNLNAQNLNNTNMALQEIFDNIAIEKSLESNNENLNGQSMALMDPIDVTTTEKLLDGGTLPEYETNNEESLSESETSEDRYDKKFYSQCVVLLKPIDPIIMHVLLVKRNFKNTNNDESLIETETSEQPNDTEHSKQCMMLKRNELVIDCNAAIDNLVVNAAEVMQQDDLENACNTPRKIQKESVLQTTDTTIKSLIAGASHFIKHNELTVCNDSTLKDILQNATALTAIQQDASEYVKNILTESNANPLDLQNHEQDKVEYDNNVEALHTNVLQNVEQDSLQDDTSEEDFLGFEDSDSENVKHHFLDSNAKDELLSKGASVVGPKINYSLTCLIYYECQRREMEKYFNTLQIQDKANFSKDQESTIYLDLNCENLMKPHENYNILHYSNNVLDDKNESIPNLSCDEMLQLQFPNYDKENTVTSTQTNLIYFREQYEIGQNSDVASTSNVNQNTVYELVILPGDLQDKLCSLVSTFGTSTFTIHLDTNNMIIISVPTLGTYTLEKQQVNASSLLMGPILPQESTVPPKKKIIILQNILIREKNESVKDAAENVKNSVETSITNEPDVSTKIITEESENTIVESSTRVGEYDNIHLIKQNEPVETSSKNTANVEAHEPVKDIPRKISEKSENTNLESSTRVEKTSNLHTRQNICPDQNIPAEFAKPCKEPTSRRRKSKRALDYDKTSCVNSVEELKHLLLSQKKSDFDDETCSPSSDSNKENVEIDLLAQESTSENFKAQAVNEESGQETASSQNEVDTNSSLPLSCIFDQPSTSQQSFADLDPNSEMIYIEHYLLFPEHTYGYQCELSHVQNATQLFVVPTEVDQNASTDVKIADIPKNTRKQKGANSLIIPAGKKRKLAENAHLENVTLENVETFENGNDVLITEHERVDNQNDIGTHQTEAHGEQKDEEIIRKTKRAKPKKPRKKANFNTGYKKRRLKKKVDTQTK